MSLSQLPYDILSEIYFHLGVPDFLALSATCKLLHSNRNDDGYWKCITENTFRLPNRPALSSDNNGLWPKLYRRLLLQTRIYQWGQGASRFGRDDIDGIQMTRVGPLRLLSPQPPTDWGIIADLQCGGWSTVFLNNHGSVFVRGILNGEIDVDFGDRDFRELRFTPGSPKKPTPATPVEDPKFAIRHFSAGRTHILALSDDGTLWSWFSERQPGVQLAFPEIDTRPVISKFVAGWGKSSAYIRGRGILIWDPVQLRGQQYDSASPHEVRIAQEYGALWIVDQTSYSRPKQRKDVQEDETGEVKSYVMLEDFVIFVTDVGKVFGCSMRTQQTFEIPSLSRTSDSDPTPSAIDVQGSFRKFAIFKHSGKVVIVDQDFLSSILESDTENGDEAPVPRLIPALQNSGVISVAFGDYHFHALHSNGTITSYGKDSGDNGTLGLANQLQSERSYRGIDRAGSRMNGILLPHAYMRGRKVWFHPEQHRWLEDLAQKTSRTEQAFWADIPAEASAELYEDAAERRGQLSEWIEQQGDIGEWAKRLGVDSVDDGLGPYFALSVTAGGWRSAALVLVNDELVDAITNSCKTADGKDIWENEPAARVTLLDGRDSMAGNYQELLDNPKLPPLSQWKRQPPRFHFKFNGVGNGSVFGIEGWEELS